MAGGKRREPLSYKDLVKIEGGTVPFKTEEELEHKYDWWSYYQLKDLFITDRKKLVLGKI